MIPKAKFGKLEKVDMRAIAKREEREYDKAIERAKRNGVKKVLRKSIGDTYRLELALKQLQDKLLFEKNPRIRNYIEDEIAWTKTRIKMKNK